MILTLKDIEFLEEVCHDLMLHANKWGLPLRDFIEEQKKKREKNVLKSTKCVQEKRQNNKLYGRSVAQLNYQKKNKKNDTENIIDIFSDLD